MSLTDLKDLWDKHSYAICVSLCLSAAGTWVLDDRLVVRPLEKENAKLLAEIAKLEAASKDIETAVAPYRAREEQTAQKNRELEVGIQAERTKVESCKDMTNVWKTHSNGLQNTNNLYINNCSILQEVRSLNARKAQIDRNISFHSSNPTSEVPFWNRESNQLQEQIVEMSKRLRCEQ